eukprot:TRINITY_DN6640_c0_g1_i2.p1 TRINITY_DN6640_c0_g1~~TRINITY_DN6640_c0_g1_i2.p1  ORF type:complete len:902 (+),score=126.60 TRINITY_DN6640_c0_g1_i2:106-2811(+)
MLGSCTSRFPDRLCAQPSQEGTHALPEEYTIQAMSRDGIVNTPVQDECCSLPVEFCSSGDMLVSSGHKRKALRSSYAQKHRSIKKTSSRKSEAANVSVEQKNGKSLRGQASLHPEAEQHMFRHSGEGDDGSNGIHAASLPDRESFDIWQAIDQLRRDLQAEMDARLLLEQHVFAAKVFVPDQGQQGRGEAEASIAVATVSSLRASGAFDQAELSKDVLDGADTHTLSDSVWNTATIVGHPSIGCEESALLVFVSVLNVAIQALFCYVVYNYMTEDEQLSDSKLEGLVFFRSSVAHSIEYADRQGGRSMIRMLCEGTSGLHNAASQASVYDNLQKFFEGGQLLMVLAQFVWLAECLREINDAVAYSLALLSIKRGQSSIVRESEHTRLSIRFESISSGRIFCCFILVVIPRIVVAAVLYVSGVFFLGVTADLTELVLNAMALAFVLSIDEVLFQILAPRRTQILFRKLRPLSLASSSNLRKFCPAWLPCFTNLCVMSIVMAIVCMGVIWPFFDRVTAAMGILCEGDLDFVHAHDPITSTVSVMPTQKESMHRTPSQHATLLRAFPDGISAYCPACAPYLTLDTSFGFLQEEPSNISMEDLLLLQSDTVAVRGEHASCDDGGLFEGHQPENKESQLAFALAKVTLIPQAGRCADVSHLCHLQNASSVRLICPNTCGCNRRKSFARVGSNVGDYGAFSDFTFGCPRTCESYRVLNLRYFDGILGHLQNCTDLQLRNPSPVYGSWSAYREWFSANNFAASDRKVPEALEVFYEKFLPGLFSLLSSRRLAITSALQRSGNLDYFRITASEAVEIADSIADGRTQEQWMRNNWVMAAAWPKSAYPQLSKRGCDFLADEDVAYVYGGIDLCGGDYLTPLADLCPEACGCKELPPKSACPTTCQELQQK